MILALRIMGAATVAVYRHMTISMAGNLVTSLLTIPLLLLIGWGAYTVGSYAFIPLSIVLLVGILPYPLAGGVQNVAVHLVENDLTDLGTVWEGVRAYWLPALRLWLLSLVVTLLILANLAFYTIAPAHHLPVGPFARPLFTLWLMVLIIWLAMHFYLPPLIMRQERPTLLLPYRNAFVVVLQRPLVSMTLLPVWLLLLLVSTSLGFASFIGLALAASLQQAALFVLLRGSRV